MIYIAAFFNKVILDKDSFHKTPNDVNTKPNNVLANHLMIGPNENSVKNILKM